MQKVTKTLQTFRATPVFQVFRNVNFRSRNPKDPHFDRKRMIEVCKPMFLPNRDPTWETCTKKIKIVEETPHPYEVLLSQELKKSWDISRMILFYHLAPLSCRTQREVRNTFYKEDLHFHAYGVDVMKLAVAGTPFTSVLHLYESNTAIVFSKTISINKVMKVNRKVQLNGVTLLAGIVDNVFYSRGQIQTLGDLFKKDTSHQELAHFLDYIPSKLKGTINYPTQLLSYYLDQIAKEKQNS